VARAALPCCAAAALLSRHGSRAQGERLTPLHALALGILQGLGEFLPISSSGHLIVMPWLLGWPTQSLSFDVALHVGTLAAVLYAFLDDWKRIVVGAFRGLRAGRPLAEPEGRLLALLALGSVPAALAGLALEDWAETVFRSPALVAANMAALGAVLFLADRRANAAGPPTPVNVRDALFIGLAQCLALVPGVSRSGATISMGLFLGHRREEAARFSFLLATPITLGAALLKVPHLFEGAEPLLPIVIGIVSAAVVGLLSIRVLLRYVRTRNYVPFVVYRFAFALLVAAVVLARRAG
jgi:undecaprenyl-diphosphatase